MPQLVARGGARVKGNTEESRGCGRNDALRRLGVDVAARHGVRVSLSDRYAVIAW